MANRDWKGAHKGGGGAVYGLGFVGALVYFIIHAQTLGDGLLGIFKAIVWPAILTFNLFSFLKL